MPTVSSPTFSGLLRPFPAFSGVPPPPPPPPRPKSVARCPLGASYTSQIDAKGHVTALLTLRRWRPGASIFLQFDPLAGAAGGVHDVQVGL